MQTVYKTIDGCIFDNEREARKHEASFRQSTVNRINTMKRTILPVCARRYRQAKKQLEVVTCRETKLHDKVSIYTKLGSAYTELAKAFDALRYNMNEYHILRKSL